MLQTSKTLKKKKGDERTHLVTPSLLELLVAAKNTEGFSSDKTFLNVVNFDLSPAEFTPMNLKQVEMSFTLFHLALFTFFCIYSNIFSFNCIYFT